MHSVRRGGGRQALPAPALQFQHGCPPLAGEGRFAVGEGQQAGQLHREGRGQRVSPWVGRGGQRAVCVPVTPREAKRQGGQGRLGVQGSEKARRAGAWAGQAGRKRVMAGRVGGA